LDARFQSTFSQQTLLKIIQSRSQGVSKHANSWIITQLLDNYLTVTTFLRRDWPYHEGKGCLEKNGQGVRGRLEKNIRRLITPGNFFAGNGSRNGIMYVDGSRSKWWRPQEPGSPHAGCSREDNHRRGERCQKRL